MVVELAIAKAVSIQRTVFFSESRYDVVKAYFVIVYLFYSCS